MQNIIDWIQSESTYNPSSQLLYRNLYWILLPQGWECGRQLLAAANRWILVVYLIFLVLFWLFCTLLFGEEHWDMEDIGEKKDFGSPCQSGKLLFEQASLETDSGLRMWGWMGNSSPSCRIRWWTIYANPPGQWRSHQVSWEAPVEQNPGAVTRKTGNNWCERKQNPANGCRGKRARNPNTSLSSKGREI